MTREALKRILQLLGLAMRAGKIISGKEELERAVRRKKTTLLFVAADASEPTRKRCLFLAERYKIRCVALDSTKEELGHAIGKEVRAAVAVGDRGFEGALLKWVDS